MDKPDWWPKNPWVGPHPSNRGKPAHLSRSVAFASKWQQGSDACWKAFCDWVMNNDPEEFLEFQQRMIDQIANEGLL